MKQWFGAKVPGLVVGFSLLATPVLANDFPGGSQFNGPACTERFLPMPRLPQPHFREAISYETVIPSSGDQALVFAPKVPTGFFQAGFKFPAVVVQQGGSVLHTSYSAFAERLARHGFVVIVPHHLVTLGGQTGPFTTVNVVNQAFDHLKAETTRAGAPIEGLVNESKLGLVGHSLGGATALQAVGSLCLPPLCFGTYAPPPELRAAVVYGANMRNRPPATGFIDVNNAFPVAMIHGSEDGIASMADARSTFELLEEAKSFFRVNGANHYGITDTNNSGGTPDVIPSLSQSKSIEAIVDTTALYFDIHVNGSGFLDGTLDCFTGTRDGVVTFED